jgi:WhiB family transcriptional regulator, redox-sensing transcriptional regulator
MRTTAGSLTFDLDYAEDWRHYAECLHFAGVVDFFPAPGESARDAKRVCAECRVKTECLEYALERDLCGVWGGLSERERRQLRRDRERGR